MKILSRSEAIALGLKRFFTGKPCKHGHISERDVGKGGCVECKNISSAAWKARNKERISEVGAKRYRLKAEEIKEYQRQYKLVPENKEKIRIRARRYADKNADRLRQYRAARYLANKERIRAIQKAWRKRNYSLHKLHCHNRRAKKKNSGGKLSPGLAERLFKLQRGRCACCGASLRRGYQLDHIVPIAMGGANVDDNIQLLTPVCNNKKNAKHPVDYMREKGFLL